MRRADISTTIAVLITLASFVLASERAVAEEPNGPSGFSGYLLDKRGLDVKPTEDVRRETFESPGVSWRCVYQEGEVEIERHQRVDAEAHSGERSELLQYKVKKPGAVVFGHYVDYPAAYRETEPAVWTRSDRPGVSLAALVVFPKTLRPDTNKPLVAVVPGATYQTPGEWRRLDFPQGLDRAVEEVAQAIRGEHKISVSCDEVYIRQLLLISEARGGRYSIWTDDIEVAEHMRPSLDLLRASEQDARFEPINLLSARLQLSQAPVFWQDEFSEMEDYGLEPFGLDLEKVAKNKKQVLKFLDGVAPRARSEENALALKEGVGSTSARSENVDARTARNVGQAGFNASRTSRDRVASVSFAEGPEQEEKRNENYLALQPNETIVSGSGTVDDPKKADSEAITSKEDFDPSNVQLKNKQLLVDGQPYLISAVEYNGEPLAYLRRLGFNAIWLRERPNDALLKEATAEKMRVVSPAILDEENASGPTFDQKYSSVLLWSVGRLTTDPSSIAGSETSRSAMEYAKNCMEKTSKIDAKHRPFIGEAFSDLDKLRDLDLKMILLDREPLQTSLDLNDYGEWLEKIQAYAPDVVYWNKIQTQPTIVANSQRQFLGMTDDSPGIVSYEQMRQLVRLSIKAGCRGFLFSSYSPLDAKDHKAQYRANALEAINLELLMLTHWAAIGEGRELVKTSSPTLAAIVARAERSTLIAPISIARNDQYVMGGSFASDWSIAVGTKDGYEPQLLTPGAVSKIDSARCAGGRSIELADASMNSLIFLTQSDSLLGMMLERAPKLGKRMAQLAIGLARKRVDLYRETIYALNYVQEHGAYPRSAPQPPAAGKVVENALVVLNDAETSLQRQDYSQAYLNAEKATREIREQERTFWEKATRTEIARPVTPLSTSFYDMPAYLELYEKIASQKIVPQEPNLLVCGDMQSPISTMEANGWSFRKMDEGTQGPYIETCDIEVEPSNPGKDALHLKTVLRDESRGAPFLLDSPRIVVEKSFPNDGAQMFECGQIVCVQGRIKIPKTLTNTVDGLTIYDDQGGKALAVRFKEQTEWKQFAFYRLTTSNGKMRIRVEASGLGEVWLDDLCVRVVK